MLFSHRISLRPFFGFRPFDRSGLRFVGARLRRYPRLLVLGSALVLLIGLGGGSYAFAVHQWHAAQKAVKEGRAEDARNRLKVCLWVWPRSIPVHLLAARAARLRGDFEESEAHLNKCLKLHGGATDAIQLEYLLMRVQGGEEDEVAPELLTLYVERNHPESPV